MTPATTPAMSQVHAPMASTTPPPPAAPARPGQVRRYVIRDECYGFIRIGTTPAKRESTDDRFRAMTFGSAIEAEAWKSLAMGAGLRGRAAGPVLVVEMYPAWMFLGGGEGA